MDRLSPLDVSFLYFETPATPMHVGALLIFEPPAGGFDHDRLLELIGERISLVPRFRQRIRWVPARLANPVWVDDPAFDLGYHVRRSALPRPGSDAQLRELVARIIARPLDHDRPLWEMYLVEGLAGGRVAVLTKTHHAMVDGIGAVDIGQVILDSGPEPRTTEVPEWSPGRTPSGVELVVGAVTDAIRRPASVVDSLRGELTDVRRIAGSVLGQAAGLVAALRTVVRPPAPSPLNVETGSARRFTWTSADLADFKELRARHGVTINDLVLAVITGALRSWLIQRGEPVTDRAALRALVPVSVRVGESGGNRIAAFLCDLPVGEPHPIARVQRVASTMGEHKATGQLVGAAALTGLAGFAPPTLHSAGARAASTMSRHVFNLLVSNVPGPQHALYAAGARLVECYPIVPLARGQALGVGVTSYDGRLYFGLTADRDALPDVDELTRLIDAEIAVLLHSDPGA